MEYTKGMPTEVFSPYVLRIDKMSNSLKRLSDIFLRLEERRESFTKDEIEAMYERVQGKVCKNCEQRQHCSGEGQISNYQMIYEILSCVERYGVELNVETKRKIQKKCIQAPRFLRETLEAFQGAKQTLMWNNKIAQNREGCAVQLDTFAHVIQHMTRELDASIFTDEHLERKIRKSLYKIGVRLLSTVFFVTPQGRYEMHVTVKAGKGECIATKEVIKILSTCVGRQMVLEKDERPVLLNEYCTIVCLEGPAYHTLQGVAKIGKGCHKISGDNFVMMDLPGGRKGVALSDGMGTGESAFKESAMVIDMLEELLLSGFPEKTAVQMMNTALVMGREDIRFSTLDMTIFDLYNGACEFLKVGASTTFVKHRGKVERITSTSLPIGVLPELEVDTVKRKLSHGDYIVMVTDGVLDALPVGEQDVLIETIIKGTDIYNPKEYAHHILEQILEFSGEVPLDDMTVLVVGIWNLEK